MSIARGLVILVWWFAITSAGYAGESYGTGRVIGPFDSAEQCQTVRAQFRGSTSTCWETKTR